MKIKQELKKNTLKFGYGICFKYDGMLAHSFRFTVFCIIKDTRLCIKQLKLWTVKQQFNITNSCNWKILWSCMAFIMHRH